MKERGKDKISITQGQYLSLTRQPQLLTYLIGAGGVWGVAAFHRSKGEENVFADTWKECVPARMGFWGVTFAKDPWEIDLLGKKGRDSKTGEESSNKWKQRDKKCSDQSKEPKKKRLLLLLFRRLERINVTGTQDASVKVKEGWPYQGPKV